MSSDAVILPLLVTGGVDPQVNSSLAEATQRLGAADAAAKAMSNAWTETKSKIDLASAAFQRLVGFVDQIAALTAEQQQLTAASNRLGLDFDQAANGAGRFVDETEAMAAASRLAEAGLHLTQEELNQLTARAAIASQRLGVDTTTAFNMLTSAIESGSARALRPFGEDMVALGGSTHSAEERLGAFTTTTQGMARATDDASTSMARLRDSVGDAEREMASSFSAEIARLATVSTEADHARDHVDGATSHMREVGQAAAYTLSIVANSLGAVLGTFATGVLTIVGGVRVAMAEVNALVHFRDPAAAHAAAMAENFGADSGAMAAANFVGDRVNALRGLMGDQGGPLEGAGAMRSPIGTPANTDGAMVFGDSQANADDAYAAAHRRRGATGGGGGRPRRQTIDQLMQRAGAADRYNVTGDVRLDDSATEMERNAAAKADVQRGLDDAASTREHDADRARQEARRARDQQTSIGAGMRSALTQYGDSAMHTRDLVVGAFSDMTTAVGKHIEAVVTGRETMGEALRGMLSDALGAIAKRASVSAAEELVSSIASLAMGDLRGAGLHAAAAVGFTAVAGLAGAASSAVAPAALSAATGHSAGSAAAPLPAHGGSSKDSGGQVVNVYFGGPVIGAGGARQAARTLTSLLNDGARQGDVRLSPNLLPVGP